MGERTAMFRDRDLLVRLLCTPLPAPLAHRLGDRLTALVGGARHRHVTAAARDAMQRLLGDAALAAAASRRFVAGLAADDLDAWRAAAQPRALRGAAAVEGEAALPARAPAVFVSFHLSGGLSVFEVLERRGFASTFLRAPLSGAAPRYARWTGAVRTRYLTRLLDEPFVSTGPGARRAIAARLDAGGSIVALLDVPAQALELRDRAPGTLFGRRIELPVGVLRLALERGLPVVAFDGRIESGRRIVRFHPLAGDDVATLVASLLRAMEGVVRERPWAWHAWLEIDYLLGEPVAAPPSGAAG